jgi:hypothetical protein
MVTQQQQQQTMRRRMGVRQKKLAVLLGMMPVSR